MPVLRACPTDPIPCPEMTPPEAGATPGSGGEEKEDGTVTLFCIHAAITLCS